MASSNDLKVGYELFYSKVKAQLTPEIIREGSRRSARKAIEVIQERTRNGLDRNGKGFEERTKRYMKLKTKRLSHVRGTRFKAKSPEDWLQFSGRLFSAMYVSSVTARKTGGIIEGAFELNIKDRQRDQATGLITGKLGRGRRPPRDFWGLSKPGTAQRRKEDQIILRAFTDYVKVKLPKGIVINK